jgi:hypothetical protein
MSNAEMRPNFAEPKLLQRLSTPVFVLLSLLIVPVAAFVLFIMGVILCIIAGIEHSDAQIWLCLAALVAGFFGSIYLLVRARRVPTSDQQRQVSTFDGPPRYRRLPSCEKKAQNAASPTFR